MSDTPHGTGTTLRPGHLLAPLRRPFASLPARIVASVLFATLVTSLLVTWMSTNSIGSFLYGEIDRRFPRILAESTQQLDQWYAHREHDMETFGESRVVRDNLRLLSPVRNRQTAQRARNELRDYLTYVLAQFEQFQNLFVLDADGEVVLFVGAEPELSADFRAELAQTAKPAVSPAYGWGRSLVQVASTPVAGVDNGLTLHARLAMDAAAALLSSRDLGDTGVVLVVDRGGRVLMGTAGVDPERAYLRELPSAGAEPEVADYTLASGDHVVGSAQRFKRFGWTVVIEQSYDEAFAPVVRVIRELLGVNLAIVALFSLLAFWAASSMVRPILALSNGALRIAAGESDVEIPGRSREDEIGVLTRAFHEMMTRLKEHKEELEEKRIEIEDANHRLVAQNQELQRVNEVFEQLSITDDLTKLHNHRFFQEHLPQEMKRADRTGVPLSLILIDIDDFKKLNDNYGHAVGDAVLRRVADVMGAEVREMDLLARYGGEEFALLASDTDLDGAAALAEKLRIAVAETQFQLVAIDGPTAVKVTVSCGVAVYRGDEREFFNDADAALYRAKEAGKDCVVVAGEPEGRTRKRAR